MNKTYKILWALVLSSGLWTDRGLASSVKISELSATELSDKIITQYLKVSPPEKWAYDWTTAIFLQGALSSSAIEKSPTQLVAKTEQQFKKWDNENCCSVTMADLAVMGFAAVQMKSLVPNSKPHSEFDRVIENTANYFATEPLNKVKTFDHVGYRHKFFWWAPPTHWFVPSSI